MADARGQVVKLDRGYPLVQLESGACVRCEHATDLVKEGHTRAVIGDWVRVAEPDSHEKAKICAIEPRSCQLVRKDPSERALPQVLAANFQLVLVAQPLAEVNLRRLERELVLAHQTGMPVAVLLTKADLAGSDDNAARTCAAVQDLAGRDVEVVFVSQDDLRGVERIRQMLAPDNLAVLIGRSGVGKSSLVNLLVGAEVQDVGQVREGDGKGRHTTVSREIVNVPTGGRVVDMPGVRGLGMWEADDGIGAAFQDVEELAAQCRFRDCRHVDEPGCAVLAAVSAGELSVSRLESYRQLKAETEAARQRRDEARHMRGQKVSDEKAARKRGAAAPKRHRK